jgi:hypothetical protein
MHLGRTFANLEDDKITRFWCDGIGLPFIDSWLNKTQVINKRMLVTDA